MTKFESIYEKFLMQIDDYELGIIQDYELSSVCYGYLDKAIALHFPQCGKDLTDVTINEVAYINGVRIESVDIGANMSLEDTGEPTIDNYDIPEEELGRDVQERTDLIEELTEDFVFVVKEGFFNFDLTSTEQYILALGMKKAWLSSKKYNADLMSKDIGDRDYKAVQGFNYIKELRSLDIELGEEIREYAVQYTYNVEDLTKGW